VAEQIAISVKDVHKSFRLPHERNNGLKQALINFSFGKNYEMQKVLQGITFDVKHGEFFGIVGRNGSGKSTLLKLLAQIYTTDQGSVVVNGSLTPFIELGVGFNPELTGRENVYLNGALLGFDHKQVDAMYDEIVDFAELSEFMDQKLKNYSSGMQVRLAFSVAIRAESAILLIDEVLAVGDAAFQQKCYDYFEKMRRDKRTIIFVTHDMSAVNRFCTRALIIESGKIKKIGAPDEVADIYVADNIAGVHTADIEGANKSHSHRVAAKIVNKDEHQIKLSVNYLSEDSEDMYVGISIQKDGVSIAEITTSPKTPLRRVGTVVYTLDTDILNAGMYRIGVGLFKLKNRELVATEENSTYFAIKGVDITKGAALKLRDTWVYEEAQNGAD
jgi:ABC-2 type transport system ATP-binding protein